ncbi:hypothetical protein G6M86_27655 (plasmid) [Agrobacterium tumefaciens]|uniref:Uncharacterized protein n=1 Tax=Agrobacterium tumefaciens TaxID=358 RepID=A0AAJ4TDE9_AGRTU|nr:hypothetical protein G6M86_27655 [Agrobacterium tumefaciens]
MRLTFAKQKDVANDYQNPYYALIADGAKLPQGDSSLAMGIDIKSIMDAGGWRSPAVFLGT